MSAKRWIICLAIFIGTLSCQNDRDKKIAFSPFFLWGFSVEGFPLSKIHLDSIAIETKIQPQIIQFYLQWPTLQQNSETVIPTLMSIDELGAVPCITWEPMHIVDNIEKTISYELILNGGYNSYLNEFAREIKEWEKPIMIRFAHEMNLDRYHWGTSIENFNSQSPDIYIKMFRYIVTFFKKQGVNNVFWVFCPNVDSIPNQPWNKASHYYPGDQYVDLLGMDGYNWAISPKIAREKNLTWTKPWQTFEQLFGTLYEELRKLTPNKPIIVFETSTVDRGQTEKDIQSQKGIWLKDALITSKKWGLAGIIWFQAIKEEDWRIQQGSEETYVSLIRASTSSTKEWLDFLERFKQSENEIE